ARRRGTAWSFAPGSSPRGAAGARWDGACRAPLGWYARSSNTTPQQLVGRAAPEAERVLHNLDAPLLPRLAAHRNTEGRVAQLRACENRDVTFGEHRNTAHAAPRFERMQMDVQ